MRDDESVRTRTAAPNIMNDIVDLYRVVLHSIKWGARCRHNAEEFPNCRYTNLAGSPNFTLNQDPFPTFTQYQTESASRAMKSSGVYSHYCKLLGNLLTLILFSFHLEVILPICFMQLTGILISTLKPPMQSFL